MAKRLQLTRAEFATDRLKLLVDYVRSAAVVEFSIHPLWLGAGETSGEPLLFLRCGLPEFKADRERVLSVVVATLCEAATADEAEFAVESINAVLDEMFFSELYA